jgi:pimeloyl-ACP methyl ester carboxylesterase
VEPRHHDAIRSFFPHAEFAGISDSGHRVHADQPEQFMAYIREFLERAES